MDVLGMFNHDKKHENLAVDSLLDPVCHYPSKEMGGFSFLKFKSWLGMNFYLSFGGGGESLRGRVVMVNVKKWFSHLYHGFRVNNSLTILKVQLFWFVARFILFRIFARVYPWISPEYCFGDISGGLTLR